MSKIKYVSISKKGKAQVVIHEPGPNGRTLTQTRHLIFKGGKWRDKQGTEYNLGQ
jgi:hypothetical protein